MLLARHGLIRALDFFLLSQPSVNLRPVNREEIAMATASFDEERLKALLKSALAEALEEHRDLVRDIVEEAVEDIALARAIEQGLGTQPVSREDVFAVLEGER
jgi:hypothetical protein